MGNHFVRMKDRFHSSLSVRRRRPNDQPEYSAEDIRLKFQNIPRLSAEERLIIKTSWKAIKKRMDKIGAQTFFEMFTAVPDSKDNFRKFQGQDLLSVQFSPVLRTHGRRVMELVDKVVDKVDNYEEMWQVGLDIGRMHFKYGALPMFFDLMGPHFVIAVRQNVGRDWYEALEYHWLAMFNVIVYIMKFGWNLQRAEDQLKARNMSATSGDIGAATGNGSSFRRGRE